MFENKNLNDVPILMLYISYISKSRVTKLE